MKNLRLFALLIGLGLLSTSSMAQAIYPDGEFRGTMPDGKHLYIEMNANGTAVLEIEGVSQGVVQFAYDPTLSDIVKFKTLPTAVQVGDALPVPLFTKGILEPINATQWRIQLSPVGQPAPGQFTPGEEIILDYDPN